MNEIKPITPQIIHQVTAEYPGPDIVNAVAHSTRNMCIFAAAYSLARQQNPRLWDKQAQLSYLENISLRRDKGAFQLANSIYLIQEVLADVSLEMTRIITTHHNYKKISTLWSRVRRSPFDIAFLEEMPNVSVAPPAIFILVSKYDNNFSHAVPHNETQVATEFITSLINDFNLAAIIEVGFIS